MVQPRPEARPRLPWTCADVDWRALLLVVDLQPIVEAQCEPAAAEETRQVRAVAEADRNHRRCARRRLPEAGERVVPGVRALQAAARAVLLDGACLAVVGGEDDSARLLRGGQPPPHLSNRI